MKKSFTYIASFLLLMAGVAIFITCKKEYSYEGGDAAQYKLLGYPNACTLASVDTNYYAGVPTDSTNHVEVQLIVTKPGTYTVSTDVVDGISFSTSGTVDTIYTQYGISLKCQGTPDSAGTFTFHIPGATGCSFTVIVSNVPDADYTLSGSPNQCGNPVDQGSYVAGKVMTSANLVTINVDVVTPGPYHITTPTVNGISFSASGQFTSHGAQQVIIQAAGTPVKPELSQFQLNAGASQCTLYVPIANPEPVATYVLQSGIQNDIAYCLGSAQGTYTSGTSLKAGNTLTVNAYVTVAGNYTISTTELDGMLFSATGTFAATGAQDVVLTGSGTPSLPGLYTFYPEIVGPAPLGGSTCGVDVTVQ